MATRSDADRLLDVLHVVGRIRATYERVASGSTQADTAVRAIERDLITIGEAINGVSEAARAGVDYDWSGARRLRNFATHMYWQLDWQVIVDTVDNDLPVLETAATAALAALLVPTRRVREGLADRARQDREAAAALAKALRGRR